MPGKASRTIRIKWVRSGIGFTYRQKEMIRSLGLRRLNQVVERPDSPEIQGLVANIPRLVEIVSEMPSSPWTSVPEYTIRAREAPAAGSAPSAAKAPAAAVKEKQQVAPAPVVQQAQSTAKVTSKTSENVKAERPARRAAAGEKGKATKATAKKKAPEKAAKAKHSRPSKKGKK